MVKTYPKETGTYLIKELADECILRGKCESYAFHELKYLILILIRKTDYEIIIKIMQLIDADTWFRNETYIDNIIIIF